MVTIEKKQNEQKQGGSPSVVDAFISALFASAPSPSAPTSSVTPNINTTPEPSTMDLEEVKSESTLVKNPILSETNVDEEYIPAVRSSTPTVEPPGYLESFPASTSTTAALERPAVKRERSLTEEVDAYSQLSKKKVAQTSTTTRDRKRFDERDYQRRGHGKGMEEAGNMSPGRGGSERVVYDHQHQRYQHNQRTQQKQNIESAPTSSNYRGKAEIVSYHLQAHKGQPASSTHILALKPVDWNTVVAESRMLIRDVPTHMDNWDLLDHFAPYGEIIEVVIKNQLGFVHFADANDCQSAVRAQNGKFMKDFKLRLEVCKQKPHFARGSRTVTSKAATSPKNMQHPTPTASTHVHLLVWNRVPSAYVHHVTNSFERASLPIQTSYMTDRQTSNQEQIIREKVNIGAVAVLNLEARHEQQQTVDLRVLNKSSNDDIHFEAYDSISLDDAIALTKIGGSPSRSISKSPPHQHDQSAPMGNLPPQHQQQYPPLDLATIQQLDVNTLAAIYDLVHVQLETALADHHRIASPQQQYGYSSHGSPTSYHVPPTISYQNSHSTFYPNTQSSSTLSMNSRSFYHYPQHPSSPPQPLTSLTKQVPIPLSTEQLGNILSSVNNGSQ